MLQPKQLELDGMTFTLQPLTGLKAIRLDKKIVSFLMRALKGAAQPDADGNIQAAASLLNLDLSNFAAALDDITDKEWEELVLGILSSVTVVPPGKPATVITADAIDMHFRGKLITLYKVMFEAMKYNKFSPFVLMEETGIGGAIQKIVSSTEAKTNEKPTGKSSAPSGNSAPKSKMSGSSGASSLM